MSAPPDPPTSTVDDDPPATTPIREPALVRSSVDRYLSGLAGGIGERTATDPLYYRIGLVAGTLYLSYGAGLYALVPLLYVCGWLTVPRRGERSLLGQFREREARQEMLGAVALLIVSLVVLADARLVFPVALAGLALILLGDRHIPSPPPPRQESRRSTALSDAPSPSPPPSPSPSPSPSALSIETVTTQGVDRRPLPAWRTRHDGSRPPADPVPHRLRREPALWPLTLALLLGLAVVGIVVDRFSDPGLDPRVAVDLALLIIGGVLMLSFWRGRAGVTALWAIPLLPLWFATSVPDIGRFANEGSAHFAPSRLADDDQALRYELGYGTLVVNLLGLELRSGQSADVQIDLTMGRATIIVPSNTEVALTGKIGLGSIDESDSGPYGRFSSDKLMNWGLDRRYPAVGPYCESITVPAYALLESLSAAVPMAPTAAGESEADWLDAFAAQGFRRPVFEYTEQEFLPVDQTDGLAVPDELVDVNHYRIDVDEFNQACLPEVITTDPMVINVHATVGLGTLEIVHG